MLLFLFSCKEPNVFIQENYIISEVHYETIDKCRAIDISGDVLLAAASSNGYMRFNIINNNDDISLELAYHNSDIDTQVGDDAAYNVLISDNFEDLYFVLDDVDNIFLEDISSGELGDLGTCGNSLLYRDMALNDDIPDTTILFTLQKHFDVLPNDFDFYSTSVGIRDFYNTTDGEDFSLVETDCITDIHMNLNIEAMKIFYSDNILTVAEGGLGVNIYSYNRSIAESFTDANGNGSYDDAGCLGNPPEQDFIFNTEEACEQGGFVWISESEEFEDTIVEDGIYTAFKDSLEFKDNFYIQGGEAISLFSKQNFVISGFDNDRGCYMALLDSDGAIMSNLTFADGYSINAIDADNGFLALASGNDGVLVYQWNGSLDVDLLTRIDSGDDNYIYDVKVDGNHVYTASENGISIYKIEGN
tara:strand:- start:319 stop:1569 length:1251 start_codon:yes stop_codon:yes gene_type:complete